jgi:hypothetical protein
MQFYQIFTGDFDEYSLWKEKQAMTISTAVGLLSALLGSVAILLAAWGYLRAHRPPKGELLRMGVAVTVIMVSVLGLAIFISNFTAIQINGQKNVPLPPAFAPRYSTPSSTVTPSSSPTAKPTKISSSAPTSQPTQPSSPAPTSQSTPSSSSSSSSATPVATP